MNGWSRCLLYLLRSLGNKLGFRHLRYRQGGMVLLREDADAFLLLAYHGIELVHQLGRHSFQCQSLGFRAHMVLCLVAAHGE